MCDVTPTNEYVTRATSHLPSADALYADLVLREARNGHAVQVAAQDWTLHLKVPVCSPRRHDARVIVHCGEVALRGARQGEAARVSVSGEKSTTEQAHLQRAFDLESAFCRLCSAGHGLSMLDQHAAEWCPSRFRSSTCYGHEACVSVTAVMRSNSPSPPFSGQSVNGKLLTHAEPPVVTCMRN